MTLEEDVLFAVLVDPSTSFGTLYRYPKRYVTGRKMANFFWNREYDNKLYMQVEVPVAGSFGYKMHLETFEANEANFVAKGRALLSRPI